MLCRLRTSFLDLQTELCLSNTANMLELREPLTDTPLELTERLLSIFFLHERGATNLKDSIDVARSDHWIALPCQLCETRSTGMHPDPEVDGPIIEARISLLPNFSPLQVEPHATTFRPATPLPTI